MSLRSDRDIEVRAADLDAAESLQSGRLLHIPEAGHYVIRDRFDAALTEIRTFLRQVDP
ncbi:Alpha/beta hydrolase [Halorhabdus sp. SVX81]|uniref:alpha/beta hydrolase n=1 Tax=Halorhabdus sp. SVX81 TaxID=2978283 RepID=UPI0023DACDDE|nr:alpha/beta hydrolase [Halorhabdus sp. SVX81]WEL18042.1 Alpha/beta hydrolase [Halorhabdus sp. SVX81]